MFGGGGLERPRPRLGCSATGEEDTHTDTHIQVDSKTVISPLEFNWLVCTLGVLSVSVLAFLSVLCTVIYLIRY